MNFKAIGQGFYNLALKKWREESHPVELKALSRLKICEKCVDRLDVEKENEKPAMNCPICGCYLPAKARQDNDVCPINKWPK
jgi:hypothetical protein